MVQPTRIDAHLVVGGMSHDFDFVRLELLKLLAEIPEIRTSVSPDFSGSSRLSACACLITYTCNIDPAPVDELALESFVQSGGRWLALHGTSSLLDWTEEGVRSTHADRPFFNTIGNAFIAHPPMGPYTITPANTEDPLIRGIAPFEIDDELYLYEMLAPVEMLLETEYSGDAPGFTQSDWTQDNPRRPVMYRRKLGKGEVLFLSPGHARGHYDAPHRTPYYPKIERGAWESPVYYELLRRSLRWAVAGDVSDETKMAAK